jgi:hypothetical protein
MIKLAEKGSFAPPPVLPRHAEAVSRAIAAWPEVHARTHWLLGDERVVDGADFYVGNMELGHIHLEGEAHIALPKALRDAVIASSRARPFRWSRSFVVFTIDGAEDVAEGEALFRLAYDRLRGAEADALLERCGSR